MCKPLRNSSPSPETMPAIWRARTAGDRQRDARNQLISVSQREREVAIAVGLGKSNAEISRELYMSVATVKVHVSRVLGKLALNNRIRIALLVHDVSFRA